MVRRVPEGMRYLTKEWFLACQTWPMTAEVQRRLDETSRAFRAAQAREALPPELARDFSFHDGVVREIHTGDDLVLAIDCPFSSCHTVTFRHARVKQPLPPSGAVWLYEELYRHKSGTGYEAHILLETPAGSARRKIQPSDLFDLKIICSEILFA